MRRVLLFAAALSLLGLSTAFAASFSVQSEDVASFTTDVSISVPTTTTTTVPPAPRTFFLRGATLPAQLATTAEVSGGPVVSEEIKLDAGELLAQSLADRYQTWRSDPAPVGGLVVSGRIRLYIDQNGKNNSSTPNDRLTAALLNCPANEPAASTGCSIVAGPAVNSGLEGNGFSERIVDFGSSVITIPQGRESRLKIVNRTVFGPAPGTVVSTGDWQIQWGYKLNRPARIEVTAS